MHWGWPQFVVAALYCVTFGQVVARWHEPRRTQFDGTTVFTLAAMIWLLYMGGFWE